MPDVDPVVLVPVKAFADAKARLATVLSPAQREALARWTAERVLGATGGMAAYVPNRAARKPIDSPALLKLAERAQELERRLELPHAVRTHWTGCPNACGQPYMGEIGLMGAKARHDGQMVEAVKLYLGGDMGADPKLAELHDKGVPLVQLVPVLETLLVERFGARRRHPASRRQCRTPGATARCGCRKPLGRRPPRPAGRRQRIPAPSAVAAAGTRCCR